MRSTANDPKTNKDWFGRKVRCIKGRADIGIKTGEIYTVAVRLDNLYLVQRDLKDRGRDMNKIQLDSLPAQLADFEKPKFILAELNYPYLMDTDRFELVK